VHRASTAATSAVSQNPDAAVIAAHPGYWHVATNAPQCLVELGQVGAREAASTASATSRHRAEHRLESLG